MRLTLLSRTSALAVLQTDFVERALRRQWPTLQIVRATRSAEGDRDRGLALWSAQSKGVFTADLSSALVSRDADLVVHSWKDLPIDSRPDTVVAATLERADPRDVLLVRRDVVQRQPETLRVLSSSPRRAAQVRTSGPGLVPWPVARWDVLPVRGNIPTRVRTLVTGDADALVVAKAALDRLLSPDAPPVVRQDLRADIERCRWMVLPLRDFPAAPAQGALALEIAAGRADVHDLVAPLNHAPTWRAVSREREILGRLGGGCHDAVGVTVLVRDYGEVVSVRADVPDRPQITTWALEHPTAPLPTPTSAECIWPRREERDFTTRWPLPSLPAPPAHPLWVTRAEALPATWRPADDQLVWTAGRRTWERLAARGIWVNGCADSLGDTEAPDVDRLAGYDVRWQALTHAGTDDREAIATYVTAVTFPADLEGRTHCFWSSGSAFQRALDRYPSLAEGWHASGPGRTARTIRERLPASARVSIFLDYDQWLRHVTP